MIALVIVYCLRAEPNRCIERRDPLTDYASLSACSSQAQVAATRYLAAHPKWKLSTWRCEQDKPEEDPA